MFELKGGILADRVPETPGAEASCGEPRPRGFPQARAGIEAPAPRTRFETCLREPAITAIFLVRSVTWTRSRLHGAPTDMEWAIQHGRADDATYQTPARERLLPPTDRPRASQGGRTAALAGGYRNYSVSALCRVRNACRIDIAQSTPGNPVDNLGDIVDRQAGQRHDADPR